MCNRWIRRIGMTSCGACLLLAGCKSESPSARDESAVATQPLATAEPEAPPGPSAEDAAFVARLVPPESWVVGQPSHVRLELEAKPPFHCNQEYPYKFTLDPSPGFKAEKSTLTKDQFELGESKASLNIEVTPLKAGTHSLNGMFAFSVCTDEKCLIERRKLALELAATDAP